MSIPARRECIICKHELSQNPKIHGCLICRNCGFVCADESLSNEQLRELYTSSYFHGDEYTDYLSDEKLHRKNFNSRIRRLIRIIGSLKGKEVFEIGCAYGFFLDAIKRFGCKVSGTDISEDAVSYAKRVYKLHVMSGDYLKQTITPASIDIICLWDTIEHLAEPDKYLAKASVELKNGGVICITTGDIGSLNARIRGHKWRQIHPPTHLQYFSKKTLSKLLLNYGLYPIDISYPGNILSVRNILYSILVLKMKHMKLYKKIEHSRLLDFSLYMNLHDYIYVIAQKKGMYNGRELR